MQNFSDRASLRQVQFNEYSRGLRQAYQRVLQRLKQGHVFGNIIVVMANPLGDPDQLSIGFFYHHANAGRPRTAVRTTINVRYKTSHSTPCETE